MKTRAMIALTVGMLLSLGPQGRVVAQSSYRFQNILPPYVDAPVFDAEGNRLAGSNYVALLYGGPSAEDLAAAMDEHFRPLAPVPFMTGALSGYFFGNVAIVGHGVPCGGYAWLQVRVWDRRLGATYEEVEALGLGGYGFSEVFRAQGGAPCIPEQTTPKPLIGLRSFSLVPEPSVWALSALGGWVLAWSRWRQRRFGGFGMAKCCPGALAKPAAWSRPQADVRLVRLPWPE